MPAVPNIVRINEIDQCVAKALDGIRLGVLAARKSGLQVEMPDEVAFDMIVVKDWQVLEATSKENGLSNETQGGGTTETSTETEIRTGKETGLRTESLRDHGHRHEDRNRDEQNQRAEHSQRNLNQKDRQLMAKLSITDVVKTQYDQVQSEDRKSDSKSDGKAERFAKSKADSSSDTISNGNSNRQSSSQRSLSGSSTTNRESVERCNIGFQMSFKVKITTKIPTEPGTSC